MEPWVPVTDLVQSSSSLWVHLSHVKNGHTELALTDPKGAVRVPKQVTHHSQVTETSADVI